MLKIIQHRTKMMEKCIPNGANNTQVVPQVVPNAPLEASKCARRPQDGSKGAKMVSSPRIAKMSQRGPKMVHITHNMTPRGAKMAPRQP